MALELPEWNLYSLEMDEAGKKIGEFFEKQGCRIARVNPGKNFQDIEGYIPYVRKYAPAGLTAEAIAGCINTGSRVLALYGHGGYHFFTYGLAALASKLAEEMGYIHIDEHSDSWFVSYDTLSCGAFVRQIYTDARVCDSREGILYLGNEGGYNKGFFVGRALMGWSLTDMESLQEKLEAMRADNVYVSIDLDVMHRDEVKTAFERGSLRLEELENILRQIKKQKRIISADIVGYTESYKPYSIYNAQNYAEPPFEQSMHVYQNLAELIVRE